MAEKEKKDEDKPTEVKPRSGYHFLSVWTIPVGKVPSVRIEVQGKIIKSEKVFQLACNSLGLFKQSRKCFALFRGVINPTKKYGTQESLYLPYKGTLTIQRWCFDLSAEISIIKTDAVAFCLIAKQIISDVENKKMKITEEEMEPLKLFCEDEFLCYKQFIDEARKLPCYNNMSLQNVEVAHECQFVNTTIEEGTKVDIVINSRRIQLISDIIHGEPFIKLPCYNNMSLQNVEVAHECQFVNTTIEEGTKVDIIINSRRIQLISDSLELAIPWRKIRQFAEIKEKKSVTLEILLDEKTFTWIEFLTPQKTLLLQAIAECIDMLRVKVEKPLFRQPEFVYKKKRNTLSWSLIKTELFEIGRKKEEVFATFDNLDVSSSEDEGDESEDYDQEEEMGSTSSVQSRYMVR